MFIVRRSVWSVLTFAWLSVLPSLARSQGVSASPPPPPIAPTALERLAFAFEPVSPTAAKLARDMEFGIRHILTDPTTPGVVIQELHKTADRMRALQRDPVMMGAIDGDAALKLLKIFEGAFDTAAATMANDPKFQPKSGILARMESGAIAMKFVHDVWKLTDLERGDPDSQKRLDQVTQAFEDMNVDKYDKVIGTLLFDPDLHLSDEKRAQLKQRANLEHMTGGWCFEKDRLIFRMYNRVTDMLVAAAGATVGQISAELAIARAKH